MGNVILGIGFGGIVGFWVWVYWLVAQVPSSTRVGRDTYEGRPPGIDT